MIGLYGVRSYLVSRRTREFGVRMAVGASPIDVLRLVLREAIATTAVGLAIGLGLGVMLGWGLSFADLPGQPVRPDHACRSDRPPGGLVDRGVTRSGSTRGERVADDRASQRLDDVHEGHVSTENTAKYEVRLADWRRDECFVIVRDSV